MIASGGSTANLVGLAVARDRRPEGGADRVAYTTSEAHSSVGRALRLIGIDRDPRGRDRRAVPDATRRAGRGDGGRCRRRARAVVRGRRRRQHQHRRRRRPAGPAPRRVRARSLAARRRRVRRLPGAHRARPRGHAGPRARRHARPRRPQVALLPARCRHRLRTGGRRSRADVHRPARVPEGHGSLRRRQLRRPRRRALAPVPSAQGVAHGEDVRHRARSGRPSTGASTSRCSRPS